MALACFCASTRVGHATAAQPAVRGVMVQGHSARVPAPQSSCATIEPSNYQRAGCVKILWFDGLFATLINTSEHGGKK